MKVLHGGHCVGLQDDSLAPAVRSAPPLRRPLPTEPELSIDSLASVLMHCRVCGLLRGATTDRRRPAAVACD